MAEKCKNDNPCEAWATNDGFCFMHSPHMTEQRALAQSKGGSVGKDPHDRILVELQPIEIGSSKDIVLLLTETVNLVRTGRMDIKVANCIGNLSNTLLKAFDQAILGQRLETVERLILERRSTIC